jgi:hypothetical protein
LRNRDGQEVGQPCAPLARELGLAPKQNKLNSRTSRGYRSDE